jgi:hypothetical protein
MKITQIQKPYSALRPARFLKSRQVSGRFQGRIVLALAAALLLTILLIGGVTAASRLAPDDGYALRWWTTDAGGGQASGGSYQLSAAIGQVDAGEWAGGNYRLRGGFWVAPQPRRVFLPLMMR